MSETRNTLTQPSICFVGGSVFDRAANSTGGSELQVLNLAECLARDHGWRVSFVARRGTEATLDKGVLPGPVSTFRGSKRFKWATWIVALVSPLRKVRADLYYERGANPLTVGTALGARLAGARFVWAVASDRDCDPADWVAFGLRGATNPVLRALTGLSLRARASLLGWAIRRADLVFCQTRSQQERCARGWGIPEDRTHLVRNGHYLEPDEAESARDQVAWIGSLKPVKRPELFLEMVARMRDAGAEFVMVGRPFGEPWESWVSAGTATGAGVRYLSSLGHEGVIATMRRSVVLVCTSLVEGFPNTFIEAWMCRTPVVSIGIDPDGLLGDRGLGVCAADVNGAVEAVRGFLGDAHMRAAVGERCRRYVEAEHDIHAIASQADGLLRGILG